MTQCGMLQVTYVNDNTLTVYIKRLREKIEDDPADPKIILTVRGIRIQGGRMMKLLKNKEVRTARCCGSC